MTIFTRRSLLRTAAATGAAAVATAGLATPAGADYVAAEGSDGPDRRRSRGGPPTFVLLHGSCASALWWSGLTPELTMHGYRTIAVDMPGHGLEANYPLAYQAPQDLDALAVEPSPLAGITFQDYIDRVTGIVRRASRNGPVILVGHSQGGATINPVCDLVPHLVDRIVYIAAMCCVDLPSVSDYLTSPEGSTSLSSEIGRWGAVGDADALGVLRVNWRSADPRFLAAVRAATAGDYSDAQLRAMLNLLEPDETLSNFAADARGSAGRWGRIPRTYVRFTKDRELPIALQDRMIAEADALTPRNRTDVRSVAAPHSGPMHRPEVVAILDELGRRVMN